MNRTTTVDVSAHELAASRVLVQSLGGYGFQFNQHVYAPITSAPPETLPDLESKVKALEPQLVRIFIDRATSPDGGSLGLLTVLYVGAVLMQQGFRVVQAEECWHRSLKPLMEEVRAKIGDAPVYLTYDIDSLDPAFAPGTGTSAIGRQSTSMPTAMRSAAIKRAP